MPTADPVRPVAERRGRATGSVLLLGGRSEIGLAVTRRLAAGGDTVVLAARNPDELDDARAGLLAAGAGTVTSLPFDADDLSGHRPLLDAVTARGPIDTAVVAFGILGDQQLAERDAAHAVGIVHTDFVAQVSMLTHLAEMMRAQGSGRIVVFSSIAGVRVRRANYVYGSAKAGLDGFATGLAAALRGSGASLVVVRPGFVTGRMTAGMAPAPLATTPDAVASATVAALSRNRASVWVPPRLAVVAAAAHLVPWAVWSRLRR